MRLTSLTVNLKTSFINHFLKIPKTIFLPQKIKLTTFNLKKKNHTNKMQNLK